MAALRILTTTPAKNDFNVSTVPTISVRFSADIDPTTVDHSFFYLTRTANRAIVSIKQDSLVISGSEISFSPEDDGDIVGLVPQTNYILTISQGIADILGNALRLPVVTSFTTGDATGIVPAIPVITSPLNGIYVKEDELAITWSATEGATAYTVEISSDRSFFSLALERIERGNVLTTGILATTPDPGQYFARVRASNAYGISAWSEVCGFTYNVFSDAYGNQPTNSNLWMVPGGFSIVSMTPDNGSVNKTVTSVVFMFTNDLPEPLVVFPQVEFESLYGNTAITTLNTTSYWTVDPTNPKKLSYTPSKFEQNGTYSFRFNENFVDDAGDNLVVDYDYWFTSKFSVMYATPRQVRLRLGSFADTFTDEQIAYHVFLTSVDVNINNSTSLTAIDDAIIQADTITIQLTKATIAGTVVSLIDARLREIASEGSDKRVLGDMAISSSYNSAKLLQIFRDEALAEYLSTISGINSLRSDSLTQIRDTSAMQPTVRSNI